MVFEGTPSRPTTGRRMGHGPKPKIRALKREKKMSCVSVRAV